MTMPSRLQPSNPEWICLRFVFWGLELICFSECLQFSLFQINTGTKNAYDFL